MKLTEIRIQNFRSFKDETIYFDDYTCLVGPNGSGKSAVLMALNVFFRENASTVTDVVTLTNEDFHHRNIKDPVRVTLAFEELSQEAQEDFKHYYRQDKLVVCAEAVWNEATGMAPVKQHGNRLVMKDFANFFEADGQGARVAELRMIYADIRKNYPALPTVNTKTAMIAALRDYEEKHAELCELIKDSNEFYGFTRGENLLAKYVQWVYIPAVKDVSTEQDEGSQTALGRLLARTVRVKLNFDKEIEELKSDLQGKYEKVLEEQRSALNDLQLNVEKRLRDYADARARLELKWHYDPKKSITVSDPLARALIGDGKFIGEVARAGHGLQRGFLVALLHELVGNEGKGGPKLLLGFEEPELYQHPPQAQHLADVLERLATPANNAQVVLTTHSPYFVSSRGFENVRLVRKVGEKGLSKVSWSNYSKVENKLSEALGGKPGSPVGLMARVSQIMQPSQKELFFSRIPVLVEGPEDVGFIATQLAMSENLREFRRLGCHFVVTDGKKNTSRLAAIALELGMRFFVIFDGDGDTTRTEVRNEHKKDNACILKLCSASEFDPLPNETIWANGVVMWKTRIGDVVKEDFGADIWLEAENKVRRNLGLHNGVTGKNKILIAGTLEELWSQKRRSATLMRLCSEIIRYSQKMQI
jgi:putative ATP-dependent endonuclease of OLD family